MQIYNMKTIQKTYNLYTFDELSDKAKQKALDEHNKEDNTSPFLVDDIREFIYQELTEKGYTVNGIATSAHPSIRPLYSLSYSQGDGVMFESDITETATDNNFVIKHVGNYTHENSKTIEGYDKDGEELDGEMIKNFNENVYKPICQGAESSAYSDIEYYQSEECYQQECEANDYTFLEDGTLFNE